MVFADRVKPTRLEAFLMFAVTGLYLIFEVAFAAQLLRVVGATIDLHEIEQIERAGRVISGLALTLVVWSLVVLPIIRTGAHGTRLWVIKALFLGGSLLACCFASFVIQEAIIDHISKNSTPEQRQAATTLTLVSSSVQTDMVQLAGLDLHEDLRTAPETMSFMALFPALALTVNDLEGKTRGAVADLLENRARDTLGGEAHFFETIYQPSANEMKRAYNAYIEAANAYQKAARTIPGEQARLYRAYRNGLGRYTPTSLPRSRHRRVRSNLRDKGIPVPFDWELTDKPGFYDAVDRAMREKFEPDYTRAMQDIFGFVPPPNLNSTTFFKDPDIQEFWRSKIGLDYPVLLLPNLSGEKAVASIYEPWVKAIVNDQIGAYISDVSEFEGQGAYYQAGVDAVRVAFIPLIAFGFSLLGAFVHSYKTGAFLVVALIGHGTELRRLFTLWGKGGLVFAVLIFVNVSSGKENEITKSDLFINLEEQMQAQSASFVAWSIRTVIQMQPAVYPIANSIREDLLQGLTFDFDPDTETPLFENEKLEDFRNSLS